MIQRKIRFELSSYDASWKDCFVLFSADSFRSSIEFKKKITQLTRKTRIAERELKKVSSKLEIDATVGKDSDDFDIKREKELMDETEKYSIDIIKLYQKFVTDRFISGVIFDPEIGEKGGMRDLVKEDMLEFDEAILQLMVQAIIGEISKKN